MKCKIVALFCEGSTQLNTVLNMEFSGLDEVHVLREKKRQSEFKHCLATRGADQGQVSPLHT